jgi:hypothetical protein
LIELWVARILAGFADDGDQALQNRLVRGDQALSRRDDNSHDTWQALKVSLRVAGDHIRVTVLQHTLHQMVVLGDLLRCISPLDLGKASH